MYKACLRYLEDTTRRSAYTVFHLQNMKLCFVRKTISSYNMQQLHQYYDGQIQPLSGSPSMLMKSPAQNTSELPLSSSDEHFVNMHHETFGILPEHEFDKRLYLQRVAYQTTMNIFDHDTSLAPPSLPPSSPPTPAVSVPPHSPTEFVGQEQMKEEKFSTSLATSISSIDVENVSASPANSIVLLNSDTYSEEEIGHNYEYNISSHLQTQISTPLMPNTTIIVPEETEPWSICYSRFPFPFPIPRWYSYPWERLEEKNEKQKVKSESKDKPTPYKRGSIRPRRLSGDILSTPKAKPDTIVPEGIVLHNT